MERREVIFDRFFDSRERKRREVRRFEYRDHENRLLQASVTLVEVLGHEERARYREMLLAQGKDEFFVNRHVLEIFPGDKLQKIESFILVNDAGEGLDVFLDCALEGVNIVLATTGSARVPQGYDGFLVHEPKEAHDIFVFLHELGHFEQEQDASFMEENREILSLEFDANRRALDRSEDWKARGLDITGFYPVNFRNPMILTLLDQDGADEIVDQVFDSGEMSIEQLCTLQLLQHRSEHLE